MIYWESITIPTNTYATNPKRTKIHITKGLVYACEVDFPPGCCGLVKVAIYDAGHQVYPADPDQRIAGNGRPVWLDDLYFKLSPPWELDCSTWNEDDTFEHTIQVYVAVADREEYQARFFPTLPYEQFLGLIERMYAEQETRRAGILARPFTWIKGKS
jgi:hypothetical protein